MKRICTSCGCEFEGRKNRLKCDACLKAIKADSVMRLRTCKTCGVNFIGGPRAWYCPDCRAERRRKAKAKIVRHGAERPLGSTDFCATCGRPYIVTSGAQKYCKDCAVPAVKSVISKQKANIPPDIIKKYHDRRTGGLKPCAACGKSFHASIPTDYCSDICRKYGKYRAMALADYKRGRRKELPESYCDWIKNRKDTT